MQKSSRELLIDAAEKSLLENGSNQTSVKQIAKYAGVNHGLVHHYFSSKEDLFIAVLMKNNGAFCESIKKLERNSDIENILSEYMKPNLTIIIEMLNLSSSMPELNKQLQMRIAVTKTTIGDHFEIYSSKKQRLLIAGLLGLVVHNGIDKSISLNDDIKELVNSLK